MKLSELINEIITEWSYRVENGMPDATNPVHLIHLGIVLKEMGMSHIKPALIENLLMEKGKTPEPVKEEEGNFTNPALNKSIKYKDDKGEDKEGIVGNLLRLPKESPGRVAAEKTLPADGTPEREKINQDLGGQGQAGGAEKPKDDKGGEEAPKEDPAKAAQAMFDPKADPAMAARMDKEKDVQAQLAKDAEEDKKVEKEQEPKKDGEFNPIDTKDVAKEMPQADPETFNGDSDIPDKIEPEQLEKFNTDIQKVAQQVADAKAKGEPAPNINLCDVTVPGTNLYCDDNLGIPRDEMPQFKGNASPGSRAASMDADASGEVDTEPVFREMLAQKGIKTLQTEVPADKLKATQKDLVGAKVVGMMGALEKDPNHPKITAPIYVSRDGYVIDGHHRWAAVVAYNAANPDKQIQMKTTVLDQDIKDAIPMANKFAEDMGIAAKKADANKEAPSEPQKVTSAPKVTEKIKKKIENWSKEEKAFFEKNEGAPGSETRRSLGQALKDKAAGAIKAIKAGAKHEVHIFKDATKGVSNFFSGKDVSEEEVKALKSVGVKIVTTAVFAAGMGGLAAGAAGFAKLVAIELVPHVVAETVLLGAGRAAVFADANGEAEDDANMIKFTELIAKGIEEMEITPEMMEDMVDSYNEKKESGEIDNVETPIEPKVKAEHLHLVDELMLEMIYGFIDEIKPNSKKFQAISKQSGKVSDFDSQDARDAAVKAGTHSDVKGGSTTDTPTKPTAKKLGAGDFRPTADIPTKKSSDNIQGSPTKKFPSQTVKKEMEKLESMNSFVAKADKETKTRVNILKKNWLKYLNADTKEQKIEALKELAEYNLIEGHAGGKKIYLSPNTTIPYKHLAGSAGTSVTEEMNQLIVEAGIEVPLRGNAKDRALADMSGKHNEAGVVAYLFPSNENKQAYSTTQQTFKQLGGDEARFDEINKNAAEAIKALLPKGAEITGAQQVGGVGKNALAQLGIDPKVDPTDLIVKYRDVDGTEKIMKISAKTYSDPKNITMKNSGVNNAGLTYLGEIGRDIDSKVSELRKKFAWDDSMAEEQKAEQKKNLKQAYLSEFSNKMIELTKTKEGQEQLTKMWKDVHGCGKDVYTQIINKNTGQVEVKSPDYYCNPKPPYEITYDGVKLVINMGGQDNNFIQMDLKTEDKGSPKLLFRHRTK